MHHFYYCKQVHIVASGISTKDVNLWHQWLGHLGIDNSRLLTRQQIMDGLSINKDDELEFCEGYVLRKQHRESFPKEGVSRASEVLRLIHCDVWGLVKTTSFGGVHVVLFNLHQRLFKENILLLFAKKRRMYFKVLELQSIC